MNSPKVKAFIHEHSNLFWYIPEKEKENISYNVLVETILNYGDWNTVKELIILLGINKVASVFFQSVNKSERRRGNYPELTLHYFSLFFKHHASGNIAQKTT